MSLLTLQNIQLTLANNVLLENVNLSIDYKEKIGLIGRNGAGKSSLLKIIAGILKPDNGEITKKKNLRISYLPQEPNFSSSKTIFDAVSDGMLEVRTRIQTFEKITLALEDPNQAFNQEHLLNQLHKNQQIIDKLDGWKWKKQVEQTLQSFSLDGKKDLSNLSGGQRKLVALAQALVFNPNLLLLDEPTNHLDIPSIFWLEKILTSSNMTNIFVTHDRSFLNRISTRIVELDRGKLISFPGNYQRYKKQRELQLQAEKIAEKKIDKLRQQEEIWIRQGIEARRTKSVSRIQRLESMRLEKSNRKTITGNIQLSLQNSAESGKIIAELKSVSLTLSKKNIIKNLSLRITRGTKLAIVGKNGVGKTTLIKLILKKINPEIGSVSLGSKLEIIYFDQLKQDIDEKLTLAEAINPGGEWLECDGSQKHVTAYLNDFLFSPQQAHSPVSYLSGGERSRLLLARLFLNKSNLLILDEPTNDLDIPTLEILEQRIAKYPGTVLLISHDREFISNVADSILVTCGDGIWEKYIGGFDNLPNHIQVALSSLEIEAKTSSKVQVIHENKNRLECSIKKNANSLLSKKEAKELKALPEKIFRLEKEQEALLKKLEENNFFTLHPEIAKHTANEYSKISMELEELLSRWEVLEEMSSKSK